MKFYLRCPWTDTIHWPLSYRMGRQGWRENTTKQSLLGPAGKRSNRHSQTSTLPLAHSAAQQEIVTVTMIVFTTPFPTNTGFSSGPTWCPYWMFFITLLAQPEAHLIKVEGLHVASLLNFIHVYYLIILTRNLNYLSATLFQLTINAERNSKGAQTFWSNVQRYWPHKKKNGESIWWEEKKLPYRYKEDKLSDQRATYPKSSWKSEYGWNILWLLKLQSITVLETFCSRSQLQLAIFNTAL